MMDFDEFDDIDEPSLADRLNAKRNNTAAATTIVGRNRTGTTSLAENAYSLGGRLYITNFLSRVVLERTQIIGSQACDISQSKVAFEFLSSSRRISMTLDENW